MMELPPIDTAQLQLTLLAVVMFPYLLPQMTEFITGMRADSEAFVAARGEFLRDFAVILDSAATRSRESVARDR